MRSLKALQGFRPLIFGGLAVTATATAAFALSSVFGGADTGFALDFANADSLFADQAGTAPTLGGTAAQQPGLILDQSKGVALGSELVVNGGFDTDTGWTKETGWTISGGKLRSAGANNLTQTTQPLAASAGSWWQVEFTVSDYVSGSLRARFTGGGESYAADVSANGTYRHRIFVAAARTIFGFLALGGSGFNGSVDVISVKEIAGRHALQTNTGLRSKWGKTPTSVYTLIPSYSEEIENAAWQKGFTTATVSAITNPYGTGFLRKVVDTSDITGHYIRHTTGVSVTSGLTYGFQVDLYPDTMDWVQLQFPSGGFGSNKYANVNCRTGAIGDTAGLVAAPTVTALPSGGYRFTCFCTATATATVQPLIMLGNNIGSMVYSPFYGGTGTGFYIAGVDFYQSTTPKPHQRVISSLLEVTQPAIASVQTAATSYGFLRPDYVDDALVVGSLPAMTGTCILAGRNGCYINPSKAHPGGDLGLVLLNFDSITGLWRAIGDLVGIFWISRTLSTAEKNAVLKYYQGKGAGGELVEGAELLTNPDFTLDAANWNANTGVTVDAAGGLLRVTSTGTSGSIGAYQGCAVTAGAIYVARAVDVLRVNAGQAGTSVGVYTGANSASVSGSLGTVANSNVAGTPASGALALTPSVSTLYLAAIITSISQVGTQGTVESISLKQLVPQALVA